MDYAIKLRSLSDDELLRRLSELLKQSRRAEAELVAHIGEVDERRLFAREAAPSMFGYCTDVLHLSEHEAFLLIRVARAARQHPMLLTMLRDGRLHLTGIAKLVPYLTKANRKTLLDRAVHKSKREIEELIAELAPRPDAPARMRKLPQSRRGRPEPPEPARASQAAALVVPPAPETTLAPTQERPDATELHALQLGPDRVEMQDSALGPDRVRPARVEHARARAVVEPLSPARYRVEFTATADLREKLERLQGLMRSSVPDGDLATIIEAAVTEKLERLEAKRFARTKSPRKDVAQVETSASKRYIPAPVRRAVHERDGGQCRYVDDRGRRCPERTQLEFHHHQPFARGGDHHPDNVRLVCKTHNTFLAERDYGKAVMGRYRGKLETNDSTHRGATSATAADSAGPPRV